MSKIVTEVDIRQIYKWSKQKLIEELRFRLNAEIGRVKEIKQLKQREQKLREALTEIADIPTEIKWDIQRIAKQALEKSDVKKRT